VDSFLNNQDRVSWWRVQAVVVYFR